MMNAQVSNIVVMLVMMQLARKIDMEDETNILYIRIAYVTSAVLAFAVYQVARRKIVAKNDLTTLKYVTPGNSLTGEADKLNVTTVRDYDLQELDGALKSIYSGAAMMGFMHLYMKYTNPLFMQAISPIKGALESNVVKIHLFGKPPTGDLQRPFKTASLFGGSSAPKTDAKSIEEAERAGIKTD